MKANLRDKHTLLVLGGVIVAVGVLILAYSVVGYFSGAPGGQPRINRWGTVDWNVGASKGDLVFLNEGAWGVLVTLVGIALLKKAKRERHNCK